MHIYPSSQPSIDIPYVSLGDYVFSRFKEKGVQLATKAALIDGDNGSVWTYGEFAKDVEGLSAGLADLGVCKDAVVALIAPNCPEFVIAFHAIIRLAATVTTVNPLYNASEIRKQLDDCKPTVVFTVGQRLEDVHAASIDSSVEHLVLLDDNDSTFTSTLPAHPWRSLLERSHVASKPAPIPDVTQSIAVLPYSSGTTGVPKGVMLSHYNLVANVVQTNVAQQYSDNDSALAVLPFFHIYGMQVLMNCLLAEGLTIVTMRRFDLDQALSLIQDNRITRLFAVPPIVLALAKHPAVSNYDLSSLRQVFSGAAPLGGELADEAAKRIDCPVVQGYGMTELSPVTHLTLGDDYKPGTSGVAVCNTECRIVAEDGQDVDPGEAGELWVRGPQVMLGYLNEPEATAACLDAEGWLRTGDIATIDSDNHMTIVDRLKELIKYKGFQIAPAELEAILVSYPEVADVAVIGVPDDEAGEVPRAFIKLQDGCHADANELMQRLAAEVASYKQLRHIDFVDDIPKSPSGKILRRLIKQKYTEAIG